MTRRPVRRAALPTPLLPEPRRARAQSGALSVSNDTPIVVHPFAATGTPAAQTGRDLGFAAAQLLQRRAAEATGLELRIESRSLESPLDSAEPCIALSFGAGTGIEGDAHSIQIAPAGARLHGEGIAGLRYAVETFAQLLAGAPAGRAGRRRLGAASVEDAPDFALRGVMLDVSRGKVPTFETLESIVDLLARMKLNALMLYTEHTFRFPSHPKIGQDASPLDGETIRRLDDYAAERCVQLIPTLQSLGHMEHVLKLPEYAPLAENERGWALSPSDERSYALLEDLYADFLPSFRSPWFNANCDEPLDLESGRSAELARELGPGGVYARHIERVNALAARHGKRTMFWADVVRNHPERVQQIAALEPRPVLLDWWYEADYDYEGASVFGENGLEFVACPGTSSWNCLFPRVENSLENISRWAKTARALGALGVVNTDWGDFGHYNLQGNSWLALAWGAQESWSGAADAKRFDRALGSSLFGAERGPKSAAMARAYRLLGAVHDPGFRIFNGSALQYAFFDDLEEGYFLSQARAPALRRCRRQLERASEAIDAAEASVRRERQAWLELRYAADASLLALDKCEAALAYLAWRRAPESLGARERKRLAARLGELARQQRRWLRRFEKLWLARSAVSNIAMTLGRGRLSVRSLRRAARALERGRAPEPPPEHEGFAPRLVLARLRASIEAGGGFASGGAI